MNRSWAAASRWLVARRRWVLAGWIVAIALILPGASRVTRILDVGARVPGSESARVEQLLSTRFASSLARPAVLVITGGASPATTTGREMLARVTAGLGDLNVVTRTFSWLDVPDSLFIGLQGQTFIVVGIDYALLVVGRFRESLAAGLAPVDAARESAIHAGRTIALSGASVAIGFMALLFVPVSEVRSIAVGGLLVIGASVLLSITLLPGLLAMIGHRVNWGRVGARRTQEASIRWRRWGVFVCAHPVAVLIAAGLPVMLLAMQSMRLSAELPSGDWLPPSMESTRGLHALEAMERGGIVNMVRVVVELPAEAPWDSPAGWSAIRTAGEQLALDPRIARVRSLPTATGLHVPNLQLIAALPPALRASLVSPDGRFALIEVMPTELAGQRGAMEIVREIRGGRASLTGLARSKILVGGLAAFNVDYASAIGDRFWSIVAAVVGVTMLALLAAFRSALIAAKAVALNLLSVAAAFGAVVVVFQDGVGLRLLGMATPLDGTFTAIPVIVFCIVFGLSMDYEVFLVARIAEERKSGVDDAGAIAEGLARTGGIITSAAAIMIVVFAAFMLGDFVIVKILGLALSVAVMVDATFVRMAIGPALFRLAGRHNWWPGEELHRRWT